MDGIETSQTPETQAPVTPAGSDGADLAAQVEALRAELDALKSAKAADEANKADAAKTELSEMERLKADLAEQRQLLAAADASAQAAARDALLDSLGVDPAYRKVFPAGDARDAKVKALIEKFAADHPRLLVPRQSGPQVPADLASRLLAGRKPGSLVDPRAVQASLEALDQIKG